MDEQGFIRKAYDTKVREEQTKLPLWKQYAQKALEVGVDGLTGLLGFDQGENATKSNLAGQLVTAGLPFLAITKGKPAFHGTNKNFEYFDTTNNNEADLLGKYIHFAKSPDYAASYAKDYLESGPRIIPAVPEAKNVLDLKTPNMDDVAHFIGQLPSEERKHAIRMFKYYRKNDDPKYFPNHLMYGENSSLKNPEFLKNTTFDAVRLPDGIHDTFAVPPSTPIRTAYGVPLNEAAVTTKPIKVIRR